MEVRLLILSTLAALVAHPEPDLDAWLETLAPSIVVAGETDSTRSLREIMAAKNVPGVQVVLIDDWQIVASRAIGEAETGRPLTTDTRFQAASISKPVAAMAMLSMVEEGALDLDVPINDFLTSWQLPAHEFAAPVTLRGLLSHTAGTTVPGFPGYAEGEELPTVVQVLDGASPANTPAVFVDKEPGGSYRYSGGGYTIAGLAAEDVADQPFHEIVNERVLTPLGMTNSSFAYPMDFGAAPIAHGYFGDGSMVPRGYNLYPEHAAASLWSTAEDIAAFAIALGRASEGEDGLPLSPGMAREMLTAIDNNYGLGIGVGDEDASPRFSHSGSNQGFKTIMWFFPDRGEGIVVLTNGDRGSGVFESIVSGVADEMGWEGLERRTLERAALDSAGLDAVAGGYEAGGEIYTFASAGDRWELTNPDGTTETAIPITEDRVFLPSEEQLLSIERDENGEVTGLSFFGSVFPKVDEAD